MLQTDYKEITTTVMASLVKEFRLLQELVDTLREERLAHGKKSAKETKRVVSLKKMVLNDLIQNAEERQEQKETLARLMGLRGEMTCKDLTRVVGDDEATQIQNLLEGSTALWKVAEETNQASQQFLSSAATAGELMWMDDNGLLNSSMALTKLAADVKEKITRDYF